jgi:hypothetical protein
LTPAAFGQAAVFVPEILGVLHRETSVHVPISPILQYDENKR